MTTKHLQIISAALLSAGFSATALAGGTPRASGIPEYELNGAFPVAPDTVGQPEPQAGARAGVPPPPPGPGRHGAEAKPEPPPAPAEGPQPRTRETVVIVEVPEAGAGASARRTECGLTVIGKSPGAVGDPCMTTAKFMDQLGLDAAARERVDQLAH